MTDFDLNYLLKRCAEWTPEQEKNLAYLREVQSPLYAEGLGLQEGECPNIWSASLNVNREESDMARVVVMLRAGAHVAKSEWFLSYEGEDSEVLRRALNVLEAELPKEVWGMWRAVEDQQKPEKIRSRAMGLARKAFDDWCRTVELPPEVTLKNFVYVGTQVPDCLQQRAEAEVTAELEEMFRGH